jgi:hypothetical protein
MLELGLPIEGVDACADMLHACRENGGRFRRQPRLLLREALTAAGSTWGASIHAVPASTPEIMAKGSAA